MYCTVLYCTVQQFSEIEGDSKKQWKNVKKTLGWIKQTNPTLIVEDGKTKTTPKDIANSLNYNMVKKNVNLYRDIPKTDTDPYENYKKLVKDKKMSFKLESITMSQLRTTLRKMRSTPSTGIDMISMKSIKNLQKPLESAILNLVNTTLGTTLYPSQLKKSKVIPLLKSGKPVNSPLSYRGINLLSALGKIIDKIVYQQLLKHLTTHKLIPVNHHGGIQGRSTVTATATLIDQWAQNLEDGIDTAIIILDQSAAYDIVPHHILIEKLRILGADNHSHQYFKNYLSDRTQQISLDGIYSEELHIGPMSVVQGSTLSCLLYLVYILDLPIMYHKTNPTIKQQEECTQPTPTTFVDDTALTIKLTDPRTNQQIIEKYFDQIQDYMAANRLHLNSDKTTLIVVSKHPDRKQQLYLPTPKKNVYPTKHHKYLGIQISDNMKWNNHLVDNKNSLTKQLIKRLNALIKIRPYVDERMIKQLANGLFQSLINYGLELWVGAPLYLRKKIQSLQLQACRIVFGKKSNRWSTKKLLTEMKWNSIQNMLEIASAKLTHSIINQDKPEVLSYRIKSLNKPNPPNTRITGTGKLGTKPKIVGRTQITKNHYRANTYQIYSKIPQIITDIKDPQKFKRCLKKYHKNPKELIKNLSKNKNTTPK